MLLGSYRQRLNHIHAGNVCVDASTELRGSPMRGFGDERRNEQTDSSYHYSLTLYTA